MRQIRVVHQPACSSVVVYDFDGYGINLRTLKLLHQTSRERAYGYALGYMDGADDVCSVEPAVICPPGNPLAVANWSLRDPPSGWHKDFREWMPTPAAETTEPSGQP